MFDKLVEVFLQFIGLFRFFYVIGPMKRAVICRLGKEIKQKDNTTGWFGTGFHLKWPLNIDMVYDMSMATRLAELQPQALVTQDGKSIIAGVLITYRVRNISKAIFSVWDAFSAAQDACQASFATAVLAADYDELRTKEFANSLTAECREQGFKYGFEIEKVRICELAPARTFRLIGNGGLTQG